MIFNSLVFFVFLGVFMPLYFGLKGKARLWLCLIASYFFYGWWDWRFLSLILTSTLIDYFVGLQLRQTDKEKNRKRLLVLSMVVNLGFLAFFKYFNFFIGSFQEMLSGFGLSSSVHTLKIILPVGISFYTFQSMSYTIDVYKRKILVEPDFIRFATFISFFPQLVAGPIVRASEFLPQFQKDRKFEWDRFTAGTGQVIWGFFKKVAIADSLAPFVDQCFANPGSFGSLHLIIGVIFYSFQIYCDFSGYSDIAIGLARVMGFDFPDNFKTPYFSRNFSEFWARWHISLSSWLRDYLYIPLGGNRSGSFGSFFFIGIGLVVSVILTKWFWLIPAYLVGIVAVILLMRHSEAARKKTFTYMNNMTTMLLGGLWHGASWAFVFWGFLHGLYLIGQRVFGPVWGKFLDKLKAPNFLQNAIAIVIVYFLTCLAWIYFRAADFEVASQMIGRIASLEQFHPAFIVNAFQVAKGFLVILILVSIEVMDLRFQWYKQVQAIPAFRIMSFAFLIWMIAFFGTFGSNAFIYFQF
ncbi:MAG: MBOAT family protein [Saprospiraceae bacterium]|nr:MBOAT family protein [Saprospiraceae bacterium]